jgi:dTDP-4-amino-4,6-dideoxygalactose transaminase
MNLPSTSHELRPSIAIGASPQIPYTKHEITRADIAAVNGVLRSDFLTNGPQITAFEDEFKRFTGSEHAVGLSSGTAGLHLAVGALGVRPEQRVLVPSLTFAATANAVLYNGGGVELVDIDPDTLLLDVNQVASRISADPNKYAGVIAVDFAGYPIDTKELSDLCKENDMWLIEDAAHALGAVSVRHGEKVTVGDGYADATVFSFHPAKHITTGEGGMVTTASADVDEKLRLLRSHGMDKSSQQAKEEGWYYRINELGYNYRMGEINAALGLSQLRRFDGNVAKRQAIARDYRAAFDRTPIGLPYYDQDQVHAYHLNIVRVQRRKQVYEALKDKGIFAQVHYVPIHLHPLYEGTPGGDNLPHTDTYYRECLSIPMYPTLTTAEQTYVIESLKAAVAQQP